MFMCQNCNKRVQTMNHIGDIVHVCDASTSSDAVAFESVTVIGPWEDYTGSADISSREQQMWAGTENQLIGTTAGVNGEDLNELNIVGETKSIKRRRPYLHYKELK